MAKRRALLIGNSHFEDTHEFPNLRTPTNDVQDFAAVLREYGGFETETRIDQYSDEIVGLIDELFSSSERGELLLLYYSGHGYKKQGRYYLVAHNTNVNRLLSTGISHRLIHDALSGSRSRHRIIILDCCFSAGFTSGSAKGPNDRLLLEELKGEATAILASSGRLQLSFEEQGRNSLFTQYLVDGIRSGKADLNRDGKISIDEFFAYADRNVRLHRKDQTPVKESTIREGELIIAATDADLLTQDNQQSIGYQTYANEEVPLPANNREKQKIAEHFYRKRDILNFTRIAKLIRDDEIEREIAVMMVQDDKLDLARVMCESIQSSDQIRRVAVELIQRGYTESQFLSDLILKLKNQESAVELRNIALHLYEKGLENSSTFYQTWTSIDNMAELRKIPVRFVKDNRYDGNVFMDILEKMGTRNRIELSKVAVSMIRHRAYNTIQFNRMMEIIARFHPPSFANTVKELYLYDEDAARTIYEKFLPELARDHPAIKELAGVLAVK